jgi:hypothetical protein
MPTSSENEKFWWNSPKSPTDLLTLPWSHRELFYYGGKGKQTETIPQRTPCWKQIGEQNESEINVYKRTGFPAKVVERWTKIKIFFWLFNSVYV